MDIATIGGIVLALVSLIMGFTFDGGSVLALVNPAAAILVFGGTLGATMTSVSLKEFIGIIKYARISLFSKSPNALDTVEELIALAGIARREGLLALEERLETMTDPFMKSGLQLVVDGVDPELVRQYLDTELASVEDRHKRAAKIFELAGGYAPTMGIIGTVMGLVHVLGSLQDVTKLGPQIATAFTATLYGVASANVIWLPIGSKLKNRNQEEILLREMMSEGILSIQAGENPNILSQKLRAFLPPSQRERKESESRGEANNVETARS